MSDNTTEGHDHGMHEIDCPTCNGCGNVVTPIPVHNQKTGEINIIQRADICHGCGGNKKVWI